VKLALSESKISLSLGENLQAMFVDFGLAKETGGNCYLR